MSARPALIAPKAHTLILLTVFAAVTVLAAVQVQKGAPAPSGPPASHVPLYLGAIAFEWLLFYATLRGLRKAGTPIATLLGDSLRSKGAWARALLMGLVAWPLILLIAMGTKWVLAHFGLDVDADSARTVAKIGPHGPLEIVLWVLVSISAGICEEFVFRGYLMRQFAAWFGGWVPGLLASAIVFGLGHAYQGLGPVLTIMVHGISFGLVALVTKRLVPGMFAHALEDVVAGLSGA
jgi:membrane protease YdiL (CAAX protease family)